MFSRSSVRKQFHVRVNHDADKLVESYRRFPLENLFGFGSVTDQMLNFCWPLITWVVFDEFFPIKIDMGKGCFRKLTHRVHFTSSQHEIVPFSELKNSPHPFDVLRRVSPITFRVQVTQEQFLLQFVFNRRDGARDFTSDESFATPGAFVVEQYAVAR